MIKGQVNEIGERTAFQWPVVAGLILAAITIGGTIWQVTAHAEQLKDHQVKIEAHGLAIQKHDDRYDQILDHVKRIHSRLDAMGAPRRTASGDDP